MLATPAAEEKNELLKRQTIITSFIHTLHYSQSFCIKSKQNKSGLFQSLFLSPLDIWIFLTIKWSGNKYRNIYIFYAYLSILSVYEFIDISICLPIHVSLCLFIIVPSLGWDHLQAVTIPSYQHTTIPLPIHRNLSFLPLYTLTECLSLVISLLVIPSVPQRVTPPCRGEPLSKGSLLHASLTLIQLRQVQDN